MHGEPGSPDISGDPRRRADRAATRTRGADPKTNGGRRHGSRRRDADAADFALLRNQIGVANLGCVGSDINGDGTVNGADLAYILSFWGTTCP